MTAAPADLVLIVASPESETTEAVAVRDGVIVARGTGADADALVASWSDPASRVVRSTGFLRPLFIDTHNHLALASANRLGVPMRSVGSIAELVDAIRTRAEATPPGQWVTTAADWHELRLAERRLPTVAELDSATTEHPVLVQRGGHNGAANTVALRLAAFDPTDFDEAALPRGEDGAPLGPLQDHAFSRMQSLVPAPPTDALIDAIEATSAEYLAEGIGAVRDAAVTVEGWRVYARASSEGRLHVRVAAMLYTTADVIEAAGSMDALLAAHEAAGLRPGIGDDTLRLWGIKLVLDGGVEAAALREPYHDRPGYSGALLLSREQLDDALSACAARGWPVGVHAFGDAAIDAVLDAVERVGALFPSARPAVVEHGGLVDAAQLDRAVALGVSITAQQALIDGLAAPLVAAWGRPRVERTFPWRLLVDSGVDVSAGTDHPIGPLSPARAIVGLTTRGTALGVLGAEHAITRDEALELYTTAGAKLLSPLPSTGTLELGAPADLAVYPVDLATAPADVVAGARPVFAMVGGRPPSVE